MEITWGPLIGAGLLAGWGVAVPLGAIGLLLVRHALVGGFRAGAAAALAVALVDGAYCAVAVTLGAVVSPVIRSWGAAPQVVAGLVLIVLGVFGLTRPLPGPAGDPGPKPRASPVRIFLTFLGLTAINPATLLYFGALTAALPHELGVARAPAVFVAGVLVASLAWQLGLALLGAVGGGRIGARGRAVLSASGYGLVVGLGAAAVITAWLVAGRA
ncbi:MAG: LysE family transporter [Cryobacterium sp.]